MKRSAADAGATTDDAVAHAKRRLHQVPMLQRMPGAWPEDDEDNAGEYVYTPLSPGSAPVEPPAIAPIALALVRNIINALNPLRLFRRRVVTPPRRPMLKLMRLSPSPSRTPINSRAKTQLVTLSGSESSRRDSFASHFNLPPSLAITPQRRTSAFQASKLRTTDTQASGLQLSEASARELQASLPSTPKPRAPELETSWLQTPEQQPAEPHSTPLSADTPLPRSRLASPIPHHVAASVATDTPAKWPPRPATPVVHRSTSSYQPTPLNNTPIPKLALTPGDQKPNEPVRKLVLTPKYNGQKIVLSARQREKYDRAAARLKPQGWGTSGFDPQEIVPTPVRARAQKSPNSARRWSPYHYEHGVTRQKQSILRSAKPGYKPFEPNFNIPEPKKYLADDFHGIDEDGDNGMFDVDIIAKDPTVKISNRNFSWITEEPVDSVQGVGHYYVDRLGINEKYGETFEQYREPTQDLQAYDPDESLLDTPKPPGFDQEQEKSPSKEYPPDDVEGDVFTSMKHWYKKLEEQQPDFEDGVSEDLKNRYVNVLAQRRQEKLIAEARARAAKIQAERDAKKAREAQEKAIKDEEAARLKAEEARLAAEQKRDWEKRFIVMKMVRANIARAEEQQNGRRLSADELEAEARRAKREMQPVSYSEEPRDNPKVAAMLDVTDPLQDVSTKLRINRRDLGKLCPAGNDDPRSGWLNDNVVTELLKSAVDTANAQLGHDTKQSETPAPYVAFHSGWFEKIGDGSGIARWASKRGVNVNGTKLRGARKIFFPVCLHNHWTIVIVDPRKGTIETMNSMGGADYYVVKKVLSWLRFELKDHYISAEWLNMPCVSAQQDNASDCGVFTIMNAIGRIQGVASWAVRAQVCAKTMSQCRSWLAGVIGNGGFDPSGEFSIGVEEGCYAGEDPNRDPDYVM